MQRHAPRWLYSLVGAGVVFAAIVGIGRWRRYGGPDQRALALLAGAGIGAIVAITLFVLDVSERARATGRRWWRTNVFLGALGWFGLILLPATLMLGTVLAIRLLRISADPQHTITVVFADALIVSVIASVAATQSILRRGGRLIITRQL